MSKSLIITSINKPNVAMKLFAEGAKKSDTTFIIIGDRKSPADFYLEGCEYLDLDAQVKSFPDFCKLLPVGHYARKNVGYLLAMKSGTEIIIESDDDNFPYDSFYDQFVSSAEIEVDCVDTNLKWYNIYRLFSEGLVWPRGLPLETIKQDYSASTIKKVKVRPFIIQGLADDNPDVDSIFRLIMDLPMKFNKRDHVMLPKGVWCPFNSQNTVFHKEAFALTYLPSYCSFRMTDIWRSFVAQRCLWELNSGVLFTSPTVYQERNEHNLFKDFEDEVPGFLLNNKIADKLAALTLTNDMLQNVYICYEALVEMKAIQQEELPLIKSWISEIKKIYK